MNQQKIISTAMLGLLMTGASIAQTPALKREFASPSEPNWQISQLKAEITSLKTTLTAQAAAIATLQNRLQVLSINPVLALGPFVTLDPNPEVGVPGPNLVFHGVNVHIVDDGTPTGDWDLNSHSINGLGNLIIGYDEGENSVSRKGSHNLILGSRNKWSANTSGAIISGDLNTVDGPWSAVIASFASSVSGGGSGVIIQGWTSSANNFGVEIGGQSNSTRGVDGEVVIGGTENKGLVIPQNP
jgi:hypothetical protein